MWYYGILCQDSTYLRVIGYDTSTSGGGIRCRCDDDSRLGINLVHHIALRDFGAQ